MIIKFLKDYQRIARFKWGNFEGMKGPGPTFTFPIIHSWVKLDLRSNRYTKTKQYYKR